MPASILTRDNRVTGLLREIEDAVEADESSLSLWRTQLSLMSLSRRARARSQEVERQTREIARAAKGKP